MGARLKKPKYVEEFTDRLGRVKRYLRIPGRDRVPLPVDCLVWSPVFLAAYDKAMSDVAAIPVEIGASRVKAGSFGEAVAAYYQSSAWKELAAETQRKRRIYLDKFRSERGHSGTKRAASAPCASSSKPTCRQSLANLVRISNATASRRCGTSWATALQPG